jgi:hypothetical protein
MSALIIKFIALMALLCVAMMVPTHATSASESVTEEVSGGRLAEAETV